MKHRYLCNLTTSNEGRLILVLLVPIFYFIGIAVSIIYYLITGNFDCGALIVSVLILGNLGWMFYLIILLPICYLVSTIHKSIDNLLSHS